MSGIIINSAKPKISDAELLLEFNDRVEMAKEIQRLREALEFYAMKSSWVPHDASHLRYTISISDREEYSFGYYGGKRAREVLNKEKASE
jgi:hypothetical protein